MRKINCLVVDDEALARSVLTRYIEEIEYLDLLGEAESAIALMELLSQEPKVDVIFLDINMPKITGMDFLKSMKSLPQIVITTAYREYAVESYEYDVLDYLVKPIELSRFLMTVQKLKDRMDLNTADNKKKQTQDFLFLKVDKRMVKVFFKDIFYVESLKDYVMVHTKYEGLIVHHNLQSFTNLLPADEFLRIHRSFTISLQYIEAINGNRIEIQGKMLPIGRNYQQFVKASILQND